ncbi:uncharacterized protein LOC118412619 [Branchiostoma floridae]|uniref:Uncharacterized protein LOC118412619 n=1 Tax=Branchiostoma floridae TaxID=7739 RepID=A0A9J7KVR3_BRAFL|nr:uncharacterized protein LOC118412619 [Branchiostoma floridae]
MSGSVDDPVCIHRPKRVRSSDSLRLRPEPTATAGPLSPKRCLELDGVIDVLRAYDSYEGGVNCSICGKLYKSKVCFTKHLWEHSVYWDLFDGEKNHDRVLSIQAALILYKNFQLADRDQNSLSFLLVTGPHSKDAAKSESRSNSASPKTKSRHRHDSRGRNDKSHREYAHFRGNHDNGSKEHGSFHSNGSSTDENTERCSGDGRDNMTTLFGENRCHGDDYDVHHRSPVSNGGSFHGNSCHDSRFYGSGNKRMKMI